MPALGFAVVLGETLCPARQDKSKVRLKTMSDSIDKRGVLDEEIFSYRINKDKKVFISYEGKQVTILSGGKAEKFIADIADANAKEAQLIMAKVTGNFKRGNEKLFKKQGR